jgi:hypothetical protein
MEAFKAKGKLKEPRKGQAFSMKNPLESMTLTKT